MPTSTYRSTDSAPTTGAARGRRRARVSGPYTRVRRHGDRLSSEQLADKDENMNIERRRRGFRIGVGALAALCATLIALSGCQVSVTTRFEPQNRFVGGWHADFTWAGTSYSVEYKFQSNGKYSYVRQSASGVVRVIVRTQGAYRYSDETLELIPDASDVGPSRFRYKFTSDGDLNLEEQISPSITRVLTYHRDHS